MIKCHLIEQRGEERRGEERRGEERRGECHEDGSQRRLKISGLEGDNGDKGREKEIVCEREREGDRGSEMDRKKGRGGERWKRKAGRYGEK